MTSLAFHPGGKILATASADKTVNLVDVTTGQVLGKLDKHKAAVRGVAFFRPTAVSSATASADFDARIWDVQKRDFHSSSSSTAINTTSAASRFLPEGMRLATASRAATPSASGPSIAASRSSRWQSPPWHGPSGRVLLPDGRAVAAASKDGAARLQARRPATYLRRLSGSRAAIEGVAYAP